MTAVAQPPNFHSGPRSWSGGQNNLNHMTADEVARLFIKGSQRTSGTSSVSSSSSTSSISSEGSNGVWGNSLNGKKKGTGRGGVRATSNGGWPAKPDIMRAPGGANGHSGSSVSSSPINSMHQAMPILPSQHLMSNNGPQVNGVQQPPSSSYLMLQPLNGTFDRKLIPLPFFPETLRIGRQTNAKTIPTQSNGYFDSKVLSRQHAEVWADKPSGRVWIRDVKSSNGTFVNGQRLSQENRDSEPHELRGDDVLELGIDIVGEDNKTIIHHKVAARVEHAGTQLSNTGSFEVNFGDLDSMGGGSLMNSQMNHVSLQNSMRGRSGSQGSRSSAMGINGGMGHRQPPMMLATVTMEMVVKKLNHELQVAKQQSQDLQRTSEFFDALLSPKPDEPQNHVAELKPRMEEVPLSYTSSPSALPPPPQLIGWEPTRTSSAPNISSLPKLKSEKTMKSESPNPPTQLLSLVDALAKARKELETKSARVQDLEDALKREKSAREVAEDRAAQLETASRALRGTSRDRALREFEAEKVLADEKTEMDDTDTICGDNEKSLDGQPDMSMEDEIHLQDDTLEVKVDPSALAAAEAANRLQRRVEEMMLELQSAKAEIEDYKLRTESAEEENRKTRKTLAEMVESIQREEKARKARERQSGSQTESAAVRNASMQASVDMSHQELIETTANGTLKQKPINKFPNGATIAPEDLTRTSLALSKRNAAPYASIVGVMLLGVGFMAVLNSWQKGER